MILSLNVVILQVQGRRSAFEFHMCLERLVKFLSGKNFSNLGKLSEKDCKPAFFLKLLLSSDFTLAHDQLNKEVIFCLTCK